MLKCIGLILLPLNSLDLPGMRVWNEVMDNPAPDAGGSTTVILGLSDPILATVYPDDQEEYARYAAVHLMFAIPIVTSGTDEDAMERERSENRQDLSGFRKLPG